MEKIQSSQEAVDVSGWLRDPEFAEYPEGAREKTIVFSPAASPYPFLIPNHRYVFKLSSPRYAEEYWMEIIAYRIGVAMGIMVPPAFVAYDSERNQSGALIEWFLARNLGDRDTYVAGGDFCLRYIPDFERRKGEKHNFQTVAQICTDLADKFDFREDWKSYWAKALTFDALIGNTDRHQDNWGVIVNKNNEMFMSPVFDNGTSLGREILESEFKNYNNKVLARYVSRGWHHMKWSLNEEGSVRHLDMLLRVAARYPETKRVMVDCLKRINDEVFSRILSPLVEFDVPVRLSAGRADFMLKLLQYRRQRLLIDLEK